MLCKLTSFGEHDAEDREAVLIAVAHLHGLADQSPPDDAWVFDRHYRIEPYAIPIENEDSSSDNDDGAEIGCSVIAHIPTSNLRYELWPNESQHRGHQRQPYYSTNFHERQGSLLAVHSSWSLFLCLL